MTAYRFVTLTCDICGEIWDDGGSLTVRSARASAKSAGWVSKDGRDECLLHNGWVRDGLYGFSRKPTPDSPQE